MLFCVIQLVFALFIWGSFYLTRNYLASYCQGDVSAHLDRYLRERSSGIFVADRNRGGLHGLEFVRLIRENEQFFYSENPALMANFQGIVNLDPGRSATWISLTDERDEGSWVVVSRTIDSGQIVQAGIQYDHIVRLYEKLRSLAIIMCGLAGLVALGLTGYCRKKSLASIKAAEHSLTGIIARKKNTLTLPREGNELAGLYNLFDQLISQNRQLIKEMQESLDNVAHDLRTPITRLRSIAEYGLQQNSSEKLAEALSDCLEESERVSSMLAIMMSVVEAESGTMQLHKENFQLFTTIADVVSLYEYVADENSICLQMNIDPAIRIQADKTRITQVWANIIDNAIKYGKKGGIIKIYAEAEGDTVSILFEDDGMGISASEIDRIWERLFRGDRSRSKQGLGLGLNYVRAVVEAHGGDVSVESTLGSGTCFKVELAVNQGEL